MKTPSERIDALLAKVDGPNLRALFLVSLLGRIEQAAQAELSGMPAGARKVAREEMRAALWAIAQAERAANGAAMAAAGAAAGTGPGRGGAVLGTALLALAGLANVAVWIVLPLVYWRRFLACCISF